MSTKAIPKQLPPPRWKPEEINENRRIEYEGEAKLAEALSPYRIARCKAVALVSIVFLVLLLKPDLGGVVSASIVGSAIGWVKKQISGT